MCERKRAPIYIYASRPYDELSHTGIAIRAPVHSISDDIAEQDWHITLV